MNGNKFSRVVDSVVMDLVQHTVVVVAIVSAMSEIDFFISSTCNFIIFTWVHMKMLMNYAIGENIGHFDNEIECAGSEGLEGIKIVDIKLQKTFSPSPVGHGVIVPASSQKERRPHFPEGAR